MGHVDDGTLNALLDGELETAVAAEVEAHLAGCAACAARYQDARRFLDGAAELLGLLTPPAVAPRPRAAAMPPVADVQPAAPERRAIEVPPDAREAGVAPLAPGGPSAAANEPPRRISKTKKEVALDLDGATQKSPAILPNVAFPGEEVPVPAPPSLPPGARPLMRTRQEHPVARRPDWATYAWAASMILCLGIGYLANEVRHRPAAPPSLEVASVPAPAATAPRSEGPPQAARQPPADPKAIAGLADAVSRKPEAVRTRRPAAADALPLADPNLATGGVGRDARPAEMAAGAAGAPAPRARALAFAAPTQPAPAPATLGATARSAAPAVPPFRNTNVDSAAAQLGGTLRTIEGMALENTKIGAGTLVPGAIPTRDVVRLVYSVPGGGRLHLDQQRLPAPRDTGHAARAAAVPAGLGVSYGDTLTTVIGGETRVRWLDRSGLWLSLTGSLPADSMRALLARIR